jgi:hypothetical protein
VESQGSTAPVGAGPVFVDPSGRRARWLARAFWSLGFVMALYTALVVVSLVVPAGVLPLSLPGLGRLLPGPTAPLIVDSKGGHGSPEHVLAPASPSPDATVRTVPAAGTTVSTSPSPLPHVLPTAAATTLPPRATPTAAPAGTKPTTAATGAPATPGPPTTQPTPRAHPHATAHPTGRP